MKVTHLILALLLFSSFKCTRDFKNLAIANNSEKTIFAIISPNDVMGTDPKYSEVFKKTYIDNFEDTLAKPYFDPIYPNTRGAEYENWKSYSQRILDKKLRIFIVPRDTVLKHGWLKVFVDNIHTKKYEYTIDELEEMNYEIVYE